MCFKLIRHRTFCETRRIVTPFPDPSLPQTHHDIYHPTETPGPCFHSKHRQPKDCPVHGSCCEVTTEYVCYHLSCDAWILKCSSGSSMTSNDDIATLHVILSPLGEGPMTGRYFVPMKAADSIKVLTPADKKKLWVVFDRYMDACAGVRRALQERDVVSPWRPVGMDIPSLLRSMGHNTLCDRWERKHKEWMEAAKMLYSDRTSRDVKRAETLCWNPSWFRVFKVEGEMEDDPRDLMPTSCFVEYVSDSEGPSGSLKLDFTNSGGLKTEVLPISSGWEGEDSKVAVELRRYRFFGQKMRESRIESPPVSPTTTTTADSQRHESPEMDMRGGSQEREIKNRLWESEKLGEIIEEEGPCRRGLAPEAQMTEPSSYQLDASESSAQEVQPAAGGKGKKKENKKRKVLSKKVPATDKRKKRKRQQSRTDEWDSDGDNDGDDDDGERNKKKRWGRGKDGVNVTEQPLRRSARICALEQKKNRAV